MRPKGADHRRVIRKLARKNAKLRRKVAFLEEQCIRQENLSDNRRCLLRRINEEYAAVQQLLQQKNRELADYADQLARNRQQLAGVLEYSPCCISVKTPDGVYTMLNSQLERMMGLPPEGGVGKSMWELFDAEDARKLDAMHKRALATRSRATRELQLRLGGRQRFMSLTVFPLFGESGEVQALGSISIDMSDIRRLESETLHAAQLASIGELAAGVAHEINNPINGIMNYAQLLADELEDMGLSQEFPHLIIHESERIAGIVRSLLDLARKPRHVRAPCDLKGILKEALKLMHSQLLHESVELEVQHADDLPQVYGNPLELQQVFMNCISNARKAMLRTPPKPEQGWRPSRLRIKSERVDSDGRELLRVSFLDNGAGIAPKNMQRIFEPFFTTDAQYQSTGLGLSICRRIVNEHGGDIRIESKPGVQTLVMVELPPWLPQQAGGADDSDESATGRFTRPVSEPM